jgi:dTDP-4-dehydrorhamnose reductase
VQKILIFGASGFLGSNLKYYLESDWEVIGTRFTHESDPGYFYSCDATNKIEIQSLIETINPQIIINCSGLANVDVCEKRPEASVILNSILASDLAKLSNERGIKFVHISTDHFESDHNLPRTEMENMWAINQYGYSKLLGEKFVQEFNENAIIVRTNFFGWGDSSKSLLSWLAQSFESKSEVKGFSDVFFTPVSTQFLSNSISTLCSIDYRGVINISSSEVLTKFDFAIMVSNALGNSSNLIGKGSIIDSYLPTIRPNFLALDNSRLRDLNAVVIPKIEQMVDNICGDIHARRRL